MPLAFTRLNVSRGYHVLDSGRFEVPAHALRLMTPEADSLIGHFISHYEVLREIGRGGMGVVYLARDKRLGRQVALKFLPASVQYDSDRRARLLTEAQAASLLHSPHIAGIYDIGEHNGQSYIVMEYVEGELLSDKLKTGPLGFSGALTIAIEIAEALDEAHSKGIIHRDIKSSNLMITPRGHVKVLDFGLAKITQHQAGDNSETLKPGETAPGLVMGTVHYMSPEQSRGLAVDERTDLFSLGVVLYEMVAGRRPFDGKTSSDVLVAILEHEPEPLANQRSEVPAGLDQIVQSCLEKDRQRRYPKASEVVTDLKRIENGDAPAAFNRIRPQGQKNVLRSLIDAAYLRIAKKRTIRSLAVLPFVNATADPNVEYLSDGITESLINSLSQLPRLRVTARTTAFRYRYTRREIDLKEIRQDLGIRAVLTGRVNQHKENLIIQADLIDVLDGSQIWGERYTRLSSELLEIQHEIVQQISQKLRSHLTGEEQQRISKPYTKNAVAYQFYLKGRYHWDKRTADSLMKAIENFGQASQIDPGFALAHAGLADCYGALGSFSVVSPRESYSKARLSAERALELDDRLAEAHTSLAWVKTQYDWEWSVAEKEYKRAMELNPNYTIAHYWYALFLSSRGRNDEALEAAKRAQELEPLSLVVNTVAGLVDYWAGRYDQAIDQSRKTIDLDANYFFSHWVLGLALEQKSRYEESIAAFRQASDLSAHGTLAVSSLGHALAVSGNTNEALKILDDLKESATRRYVASYFLSLIYIGLGLQDEALESLQRAYQDRSWGIIWLATDPKFRSLRSNARFQNLVRQIND